MRAASAEARWLLPVPDSPPTMISVCLRRVGGVALRQREVAPRPLARVQRLIRADLRLARRDALHLPAHGRAVAAIEAQDMCQRLIIRG